MGLLETYSSLDNVAGINIHINADGNVRIDCCWISLNGSSLTFEKKLSAVKDLKTMAAQLLPKIPVALNITGKGVLTKQVDKLEAVTAQTFSLILPNANIEDFYVQHFISGESSFVSLIRRTDADKWMAQAESAGVLPLLLSLGPFALDIILPQLNVYDGDIAFDGHLIKRESGDWLSVLADANARLPFPLKADVESLNEEQLLPYAAGFQLVTGGDVALADVAGLSQRKAETLTIRKLKVTGSITLAIFFVLLLVNFVWFSSLNAENARLLEQVSTTSQNETDIQQATAKAKKQEALLAGLGWDGGLRKSRMIDDLASMLPSTAKWTSLEINPEIKKRKSTDSGEQFTDRQIIISGETERLLDINEWLAAVKTKAWVKNAKLSGYTYDNEISKGRFSVLIEF